jgi:hypothetical protein
VGKKKGGTENLKKPRKQRMGKRDESKEQDKES